MQLYHDLSFLLCTAVLVLGYESYCFQFWRATTKSKAQEHSDEMSKVGTNKEIVEKLTLNTTKCVHFTVFCTNMLYVVDGSHVLKHWNLVWTELYQSNGNVCLLDHYFAIPSLVLLMAQLQNQKAHIVYSTRIRLQKKGAAICLRDVPFVVLWAQTPFSNKFPNHSLYTARKLGVSSDIMLKAHKCTRNRAVMVAGTCSKASLDWRQSLNISNQVFGKNETQFEARPHTGEGKNVFNEFGRVALAHSETTSIWSPARESRRSKVF